ncbi:MAG: hypothetical protein ABI596_05990 [Pyrinomonadaceae bacterium]
MNKSLSRVFLGFAIFACASLNPLAQGQPAVDAPAQFVSPAVGTTQADKPWEKFSPEGGGFTVLMPGTPTVTDQEVPFGDGKLVNHLYMVQANSSVYIASYAEFPMAVTDPAVIKAMLDNARDKGVAAANGELRSEKEIKLGENPGREWLVSIPGAGIARARAYWVKQRLYQAFLLMPEGKGAEEEAAREAVMSKFLNSFALISTDAPR